MRAVVSGVRSSNSCSTRFACERIVIRVHAAHIDQQAAVRAGREHRLQLLVADHHAELQRLTVGIRRRNRHLKRLILRHDNVVRPQRDGHRPRRLGQHGQSASADGRTRQYLYSSGEHAEPHLAILPYEPALVKPETGLRWETTGTSCPCREVEGRSGLTIQISVMRPLHPISPAVAKPCNYNALRCSASTLTRSPLRLKFHPKIATSDFNLQGLRSNVQAGSPLCTVCEPCGLNFRRYHLLPSLQSGKSVARCSQIRRSLSACW